MRYARNLYKISVVCTKLVINNYSICIALHAKKTDAHSRVPPERRMEGFMPPEWDINIFFFKNLNSRDFFFFQKSQILKIRFFVKILKFWKSGFQILKSQKSVKISNLKNLSKSQIWNPKINFDFFLKKL